MHFYLFSTAGLKMWKKDYDRVSALAKGAYSSTKVMDIQAESLFLLARVHHARDDLDAAQKLYEKACKFAPDLSPARFGLAQTLIAQEDFEAAAAHLKLVLGTSATATDALALLGLLEVKSGKKKDGLLHLKKAIDLDPLNPDLIALEALALQQQKSDYPKSLERYRKAAELLEKQDKPISHTLYCNIGVLCHETNLYDDALEMYKKSLETLGAGEATIDNEGIPGGRIRHKDNQIFFQYLETGLQVETGSDESVLKLLGEKVADHPLKIGDHVKVGDIFETDIVEIQKDGDSVSIKLREKFVPRSDEDEVKGKKADDAKGEESKKDDHESKKDEEAKKDHEESKMEIEEEKKEKAPKQFPLSVKRENTILSKPEAITIAFNIARVHENAGRTLAAVELLKAIAKRAPTYVNCYLRLACIARDCGSLKECSSWLKIACQAAPGNPEVLALVGNLHLSLCDWGPAQKVFDQLLSKKVSSVEAYSKLSMGNIFFANLNLPKTYAKHLLRASDMYKSILKKDKANAYAANGIGTVLAEKGELFKAKEVFNRVREVSGATIADAHLNLGHIYLAQKKHPEALQMYQSYMKRTQDGTAPITTKSREDDEAEVLLYIAFAYFDWARLTEQFNNVQAAPADERYKKCIEHLELALNKSKKKEVILRYNLCMTKLQAANCVLQKLTRNIRRTAQEVQDALIGLEESLPRVEEILKWKNEGKKIHISGKILEEFIVNCKANIESAKSHLEEEKRRETEANEIRELQRVSAESKKREEEIRIVMQKEEAARKQEERDRRAAAKMQVVQQLAQGWQQEAAAEKVAADKKKNKAEKNKGFLAPEGDDLFNEDEEEEKPATKSTNALFEDSSDEEDDDKKDDEKEDDEEKGGEEKDEEKKTDDQKDADEKPKPSEKDLFGDSSDDESDEELVPTEKTEKKRTASDDGDDEEAPPAKKSKADSLFDDDDD